MYTLWKHRGVAIITIKQGEAQAFPRLETTGKNSFDSIAIGWIIRNSLKLTKGKILQYMECISGFNIPKCDYSCVYYCSSHSFKQLWKNNNLISTPNQTPFFESILWLRKRPLMKFYAPVLFVYTDGGPDHRLTYISVQISLICLFKKLDLDYLCACRTAPYHSWRNPVERIMSVIILDCNPWVLLVERLKQMLKLNFLSAIHCLTYES